MGAAVGYDFTSKLGAEGEFAYLFDVEGNDANVDSPVQNYSANVVYHVNVKHATPYATFGLGVEHIGRSVKNPDVLALYLPPATEIAYNFGGGVKYPLTPNFLVRGDFRRFQANDLAPNYWRIYSGLTWWIKREAHTCQSAMGALTWRACAEMHRSPDAVVPPSDTLIPIGSLARIGTRRHLARIGTCRHPRTDRHP